jgi:pimeloyl-ACP methyl ester carboxylesterase
MIKGLQIGALAVLLAQTVSARDIGGDWQGTLDFGARKLRTVLHIVKADRGQWKGRLISLDTGDVGGFSIDSLTIQGSHLRFSMNVAGASYDGMLSPDRNLITGHLTMGQNGPLPLDFRRSPKEARWQDSSPHTIQSVTVDKDVKLEVLDWGGSGRPVVLLAGLGNSAHVFDIFALKLTGRYHVYGITRRGFGSSSAPSPTAANYAADRLGDDVLAVCAFLKLNHPILVGHSIAGEELSSIGSRHPDKVAGLIYLEAGYNYAFYDRSRGDLTLDTLDLQRKLEQIQAGSEARNLAFVKGLLHTTLPQFQRDLQALEKDLETEPPSSTVGASARHPLSPTEAVFSGEQKYTEIRAPVLAIYAVPDAPAASSNIDAAARAKAEARDQEQAEQAKALAADARMAHIVRLRHANHFIFRSNEADVLHEIDAFIGNLPSEQPVSPR